MQNSGLRQSTIASLQALLDRRDSTSKSTLGISQRQSQQASCGLCSEHLFIPSVVIAVGKDVNAELLKSFVDNSDLSLEGEVLDGVLGVVWCQTGNQGMGKWVVDLVLNTVQVAARTQDGVSSIYTETVTYLGSDQWTVQ